MAEPILIANNLAAGYGKRQVLHDVSLEVAAGEVVAIIGRNGSGKSTLLKALFGIIPLWEGEVLLDGESVVRKEPAELLRSGVALVPQGGQVFSDLTVQEHLQLSRSPQRVETNSQFATHLFQLYPVLESRLKQRAGSLSGGERQQLAVAMALSQSPKLLLLDEPSMGLAPALAIEALKNIKDATNHKHAGCLIVEQKVREVLRISDRVYVLRDGYVSYSGTTSDLDHESKFREAFF